MTTATPSLTTVDLPIGGMDCADEAHAVETALGRLTGGWKVFLGVLPPVWATAAQSLPDVAIMLNSARLLRAGPREPAR